MSESVGGGRKTSLTTGRTTDDKTRQTSGSSSASAASRGGAGRQRAHQRHASADDTADARAAAAAGSASGGSVDYEDEMDHDITEMTSRGQHHRRRLKPSLSVDSGDMTAASSGRDSDSTTPTSTTSNSSLKAVWKRAMTKLGRLRSGSEESKSSSAASSNRAGSGGEELDPVYSFLKLTAVMPREGTTVMPGDGHHCCGKTDQDIGTAYSDPSRCQCPCHLPERLQSVHNDWIKSFSSSKKT